MSDTVLIPPPSLARSSWFQISPPRSFETPTEVLRYDTARPQVHVPGCTRAPTRIKGVTDTVIPSKERRLCDWCRWTLPGAQDFARTHDALTDCAGLGDPDGLYEAMRQTRCATALQEMLPTLTDTDIVSDVTGAMDSLTRSSSEFFATRLDAAWARERDAAFAHAGVTRALFEDSPALMAVRAGDFAMGGHSGSSPEHTLTRWLTQAPCASGRTKGRVAVVWSMHGELAQLARLATAKRNGSPVVDLPPGADASVLSAAMDLLSVLQGAGSPLKLARAALEAAQAAAA